MERFKTLALKMPLLLIPIYFLLRIMAGFRVYKRLIKKYGTSCRIYVSYHPANGDNYLIGAFFESVLNRDGAMENAVLTVVGRSNLDILSLFDVHRTELLSLEDSNNMVRMLGFLGNGEHNVKILHGDPHILKTGILEKLGSFRGIHFWDMMLYTAFQEISKGNMRMPQFIENDGYLDEILKQFSLEQGKTAVLSPYANSMDTLSMGFWENLASILKDNGFAVCTNVNGKNERSINGTVGVFVPYRYLVPFLEKCGLFIGLRSGLCEVASSARCLKIVLYPNRNRNQWGVGDPKAYFSLNDMGLSSDTVELKFGTGEEAETLITVLARLREFGFLK